MGTGKPLPYLSAPLVATVSFAILYLLATAAQPATAGQPLYPPSTVLGAIGGAILSLANAIASVFPAPLNGFKSTGIAVLALVLTLGIKLMDAPQSKFRRLEGKLSRNPKIRDPAAVAATIGRNKYGPSRFQRLSRKARRS